MSLDLRELAIEYNDYVQMESDEDYIWTTDELEEYEELKALNVELEDLLDYPNQCGDLEIVEKGYEAGWAQDQAAMFEWIGGDNPLYHFVNWQEYGEYELQHWPEFTFRGDTFYYNDMR